MAAEAVQHRLVALALLGRAMRIVDIEGLDHAHAAVLGQEGHAQHVVTAAGGQPAQRPQLGVPSRASIRQRKAPPTRRSTSACVVRQSGEAAFHFMISSGVVHACQTASSGACAKDSTVICMTMLRSVRVRAV
jgi:hypothetical protein